MTAVVLPLRIGSIWLHRRMTGGETARGSLRVATALTPTLIFTLVLATIMRERFQVSDTLYGALLIYAGVSTLLPSLVLAKPVDFNVLVGPLPDTAHNKAVREADAGARAARAPAQAATDAALPRDTPLRGGETRPNAG